MRCPKCEHDQKLKHHTSCARCNHLFTFLKGDKITDYQFSIAVNIASKNNTTYFTQHNLYHAYLRLIEKKYRKKIIYSLIGFFISLAGLFSEFYPIIIAIDFILIYKLVTYFLAFRTPVSFDFFAEKIPIWRKKNKKDFSFFISSHQLKFYTNPEKVKEDDIFNYGLEGIVMVDQAYYVDWLILNDFHINHRVAIIAMNGYPKYLISPLTKILTENPTLPVYYLHDATTSKEEMTKQFNVIFKSNTHQKFVDLGLSTDNFINTNILKKRINTIPFSKKLPLDTLFFHQLSMVFTNAKSQIDEKKYLDNNNEGIEFNNIDFVNIDFTSINMNLDFG